MKERQILFSAPMVRALLDGSKTQTRRPLNPQPVWVPNWGIAVGGSGAWRIGSPAAMGLSQRGDYWSATFDEENIRRYATAEAYGWGASAGCPYGQPGDRLWVKETFYAFGRWETRFSAKKGRDEWHFVDMTLECGLAYRYAADSDELPHMLGRRDAGPTPNWWKRPAIFMPRWASRITLEITGVRVERLQDISDQDCLAEGVADMVFPMRPGLSVPRNSYADLWESLNGEKSWDANPWVWVVEFRRIS